MSSVFEVRRNAETETGAGGKIVRRRRYAAASAVHPYRRTESPPRSESPSWVSGILAPARTIAAGAGKLLSFAFGPSSPRDSSSSSSDSDDDEDDDYSEDDGTEVEKLNQLQNKTTPMATEEQHLNRQSSAQKSESKRVIERLLLQETFTRDECMELMKIIQSRVVDGSTMKEGAWRSSLQFGRSPEAYPYSMNGFSALSPGSSAFRDHIPNLCDTAIMEAKKWLEEKKLEPCSNSEQDHGHCSLSTGVLPQVTEGDMASPVDMAKSYMRSRPPWASQSWNNSELKTPPPIGILHYSDESSHPMAHYSSPLTKELKRNSLSIGPWGTFEETRRVRLKSIDDMVDRDAHEQIDSSTTKFNNKPTQTLPVPDKEVLGTNESSFSPAVNTVDASPKLPVESPVDKSCQNGILHPSDENAVEVNLLVANHVMDGTNKLTPSEAEHSGPEKGISASNPIITISEKSEGLEEAQTTKELLVSSDKASHESPVPDSTPVQYDGARVVLNSEPEAAVLERDDGVIPCGADGVANHDSVYASSLQISYQAGNTVQAEKTLQLHESPVLEEAYSLIGSISQGEVKNKKDANGVGNSDDVNDSLLSGASLYDSLNAERRLKPPDETAQNSTSSDHGEVVAHKPGESCELLREASIEVPVTDETDSFSEELQNGTSKTMNEAPQIQPQKKWNPARGWARGRRPRGYSRRGRGRGK
ncbi:hypothetical protein AAC387_Pa04g0585 [Persea americana]